jgi:hypothetical protein
MRIASGAGKLISGWASLDWVDSSGGEGAAAARMCARV